MKIKLINALPLAAKHGAFSGREFNVARRPDSNIFAVNGDAGEECIVFAHECEITDASNTPEIDLAKVVPSAPKIDNQDVQRLSEPEKLRLAISAVDHVLSRIRESKEIRYHLGYGTESFSRLIRASAAFHGKKIAECERAVLGDN